ncbi:MAG: hypothetical protein KAJ00_06645 [Deltaproteobacteria bacterium]|nr:hypothetical protein [Deltaproteobacteria bacterium]
MKATEIFTPHLSFFNSLFYLSGELTDQQLLDRSSVFVLDEEKGNQKIAIKLE